MTGNDKTNSDNKNYDDNDSDDNGNDDSDEMMVIKVIMRIMMITTRMK